MSSKREANENLIRRTIRIALPLAQLGRNAVVHALENLATLVPVALPVPAILVAEAVRFDAEDLAFDRGNGHVEVVVAAATGAACFPLGDLPIPPLRSRDLAVLKDGRCEGAGGEGEDRCEGDHCVRIEALFENVCEGKVV